MQNPQGIKPIAEIKIPPLAGLKYLLTAFAEWLKPNKNCLHIFYNLTRKVGTADFFCAFH